MTTAVTNAKDEGAMRSVFISGCSVGVGNAAARLLAENGWQTFAGVRKLADADDLVKASNGAIEPVVCDVRDREQVFEAATTLTQQLGGRGLDALICNAGVGSGGPLEFLDEEQLRTPVDVNLFGSVYCVQAFLPLLRTTRGRIILVTSGSVNLTMPLTSTYPASKLGLELLGRQLQAELGHFGIHVSVVDPGHVKTRMTLTSADSNQVEQAKLPPEAFELYGEQLENMNRLTQKMAGTGIDPEQSARTYLRALTDPKPKAFYTAASDAAWLRRIAKWAPESVKAKIAKRIMQGG